MTLVTSNLRPSLGETFFVDVYGSGFPDTVGATLKLTFDSAEVSVLTPTITNGIVIPAGSRFTGGIVAPSPFLSGDILNVLAPTVGILPTGNFGGAPAFRVYFNAIGSGGRCEPPDYLCRTNIDNIALIDDQADFSWTDATTFSAIPVTYVYSWVPLPPTVWLLATGLAGLGANRLRPRTANG